MKAKKNYAGRISELKKWTKSFRDRQKNVSFFHKRVINPAAKLNPMQ